MLSQHPDVEARVVAELDHLELLVTAERPRPRPVSYADLSKLEYLQTVIKVRPIWPTILESLQPSCHPSPQKDSEVPYSPSLSS